MSALLPGTTLKSMVRSNALIRKLDDTYEPIIAESGQSYFLGQYTPRIHSLTSLHIAPPFSASWGFSPLCSRGQVNPPRFQPWTTGSDVASGAIRAIQIQEFQANRRHQPHRPYQPGQWVWLSTRDIKLRLPSRKLSPRNIGPFKIPQRINEVT